MYAVRMEGRCYSTFLGQNLETEVFPYPSEMSKDTFCVGLFPHVHISVCWRTQMECILCGFAVRYNQHMIKLHDYIP